MNLSGERRHARVLLTGMTLIVLCCMAACSSSTARTHPASTPSATAPRTPAPSPTATISLPGAHAAWTSLPDTPAGAANVTFAPSNPQVAYLCTSVNTGASNAQPKLYQTADAGQHWQEAPALPSIQIPANLPYKPLLYCNASVDAADARDIFLQQIVLQPAGAGYAVARALYRSHDGGVTWGVPLGTLDKTNGFGALVVLGSRVVAQALPSVYGVRGCDAAHPFPPEQPSSVLYASDDGGQTWQPLGQPIEDHHLAVTGMTTMGSTLLALARTLNPGGCGTSWEPQSALWRSDDAGRSWQPALTLASPGGQLGLPSCTLRDDNAGYSCAVLLTSSNAGKAPSVLFSNDSSATWAPLPGLDATRTGITDPSHTSWDMLIASPSGAVLAEVYQYPLPGGPSGVFAIRPSDPQPTWTPYATTTDRFSEHMLTITGPTLWELNFSSQPAVLEYLPLP